MTYPDPYPVVEGWPTRTKPLGGGRCACLSSQASLLLALAWGRREEYDQGMFNARPLLAVEGPDDCVVPSTREYQNGIQIP
jgi:hypothetical protein